jgi:hypothetical protein
MEDLDNAMNEYLERNPPGSREERKRMKKLAGITESVVHPKVEEAIEEFRKVIDQIKK